jgi:hypothetical protein
MLDINKRVSIEKSSIDASKLATRSSDDSINSLKYSSSPVNSHSGTLSKKKKKLLFTEDSNDSDFEYY